MPTAVVDDGQGELVARAEVDLDGAGPVVTGDVGQRLAQDGDQVVGEVVGTRVAADAERVAGAKPSGGDLGDDVQHPAAQPRCGTSRDAVSGRRWWCGSG
jgi:hypothetical protein